MNKKPDTLRIEAMALNEMPKTVKIAGSLQVIPTKGFKMYAIHGKIGGQMLQSPFLAIKDDKTMVLMGDTRDYDATTAMTMSEARARRRLLDELIPA